MAPFMQHLSIAELLGSVCGKSVRTVAALAYLVIAVAVTVAEIGALFELIDLCLGDILGAYAQTLGIIVTLVTIVYTLVGGVRAVVWTDVLQIIIFIAVVPIFFLHTLMQTGKSVSEILALLPADSSLLPCNNFMKIPFGRIAQFLIACLPIYPEQIQRLYMAATPAQGQRAFLYAGGFSVFILYIIHITGVLAASALPLTANGWIYLFSSMPVFLKGCLLCSIIAMIISTVDSRLHVCAVLVSNDLLPHKKHIQPIADSSLINASKMTILVIGLAVLSIVLLQPTLGVRAGDAWTEGLLDLSCSVVLVPSVLVIYGFRSGKYTVLMGMFVGFITILGIMTWDRWRGTPIMYGHIYAHLANSLAIFIAHYLLPWDKDSSKKLLRLPQPIKEIYRWKSGWKITAVLVTLLGILGIIVINGAIIKLSPVALLSLFGLTLGIGGIIGYSKLKVAYYKEQIRHYKQYQAVIQKLNPEPYALEVHAKILQKIVKELTNTLSFMDDVTPLYKEDVQRIIDTFFHWVQVEEKSFKPNYQLKPTAVNINQLIYAIKVGMAAHPPGIKLEKQATSSQIICDLYLITHLLVIAIMRMMPSLDNHSIRVALYPTKLAFRQRDIDDYNQIVKIPAIAIVISNPLLPLTEMPSIQACYTMMQVQESSEEQLITSLDKRSMELILHIHRGYLDLSNPLLTFIVIPEDIRSIL